MRCRPLLHALTAGVAYFSVTAATSSAQSDFLFETSYLPTSTIIGSPMTTSYLPTAYVVPTTYASTSYVPTSYLSSSYVTTSRFRPRRFVERTSYFASPSYLATSAYLSPTSYIVPTNYLASSAYVPTSYVASSAYLPTTYVSSSSLLPTSYVLGSGLIATSASIASPACCDSSPAPVQTMTTRRSTTPPAAGTGSGSGTAIMSKPTGTSAEAPERAPSAINNDPAPEVDSRVRARAIPATPTQQPPPNPAPVEPATPPAAPLLDDKKPEDMPIPGPGTLGAPSPRANEMQYRGARKPASYDEIRNILKGRVVSYDSGRPEEGVTVVVSSRTNAFTDRTAMTDADGDFKLSLPEGDWTVKVRMPSGRVLAVGRDYVTASNGRVIDSSGHSVRDLLITR